MGAVGALLGSSSNWSKQFMQNIEIDDLLRELDECEESEVVSVGAESFI